jgi:hypothetical protein
VERARQRLRDARGGPLHGGEGQAPSFTGGEVAVREGVAAEAPSIVTQPKDVAVTDEGTAKFVVEARVSGGVCVGG